ncbi:MAG: hypothetical protein AAF960_14890 [Bacteroidota bacterium]
MKTKGKKLIGGVLSVMGIALFIVGLIEIFSDGQMFSNVAWPFFVLGITFSRFGVAMVQKNESPEKA